MMKDCPTRRPCRPSEEGYILIAVMFMLALLVIAMAVAAPKIAKAIQRDREVETMHRGKQYARAIKLYYKKFGAYPPSVDALVNTNQIRFLRKKYIDPMTSKDDWKPIRFGQNKTQTMGFFGQPIAGSTVAGIGPSGGNGLNGSSTTSGGFGSPTGSGSIFSPTDSGTIPTVPSGAPPGSTNTPVGVTDPNAAGGTAAGPGTGTGLTGQTFGGGGIIGFSPASPKLSILVYKKKNHYNEWEFIYDPLSEQMMQGGNIGTIGQPAGSTTTPVGGSSGSGGTTGVTPDGSTPTPQQ